MSKNKIKNPAAKPNQLTVHLIGHAHLDLAYRWRWSETIHYAVVETFGGVLQQMKKSPGLTFAQSQLALYEAVEKHHPELFKEVKEKIQEGTWVVVGGMWSESDTNMPSGESLVRQLLVGKRYAKNRLGVDPTVVWLPDVFGHSANIPQICQKAGMRYYVAGRCIPGDKPIFWWEGIDGSRILVYRFPHGYSGALNENLPEQILDWAKDTPVREILYLYGVGDHGGGPRDEDIEGMKKLSQRAEAPKLIFGNPEDYFPTLEKKYKFPVHKGELNFFARGAYTTQARVKRMNRRAENLLLTAEKFATNVLFAHRKPPCPRYEVLEAWKWLLRLQFHDNLPGTSFGPVYDDNQSDFQGFQKNVSTVLQDALETIGSRLDTRGEGIPIVVYNAMSWERSEAVEVKVRLNQKVDSVVVVNHLGQTLPAQILNSENLENGQAELKIVFLAEKIPSLGYRLFWIRPGKHLASDSGAKAESSLLENEFLRVKFDSHTGQITSIFDKRACREILSAPASLQVIAEDPVNTAWTMRLTDETATPSLAAPLEVRENGPVRAKIRIRSRFRDSSFIQDISLSKDSPFLLWETEVDWQESDTCLKVVFPVSHSAEEATFEIPYGSITRPANEEEVPALNWIDLSDQRYGASLLNTGQYGFSVGKNILKMSLLRSPRDMDPRTDRGTHQLRLAFYPHQKDWQAAGTVRRAYELNSPLMVKQEGKHEGNIMGWGNPPEKPLPPSYSFLRISPSNLVVTTMKPEEEKFAQVDYILRFYETEGKKVTAKITCPVPVETAYECNLMEKKVSSNKVKVNGKQIQVPVGPYEIKTLYICYAQRFAGTLPGEWEGMEQEP